MEEAGAVARVELKPKSTLGSLAAAALFGAFVAIGLLYMWGANIAKEEGLKTLRSSAELSQ